LLSSISIAVFSLDKQFQTSWFDGSCGVRVRPIPSPRTEEGENAEGRTMKAKVKFFFFFSSEENLSSDEVSSLFALRLTKLFLMFIEPFL
jgi:hypothetical protein